MPNDTRATPPGPQCGGRFPSGACRADLRQVIAALGAALTTSATERDLPVIFEHQVQQLLALRGVRLREIASRYQARLVTPTRTADSVVLNVPTGDPRLQAVLEASCEPNRLLDEWDLEVLGSLAHLGGLVLE